MYNEECVSFANKNGLILRGILHKHNSNENKKVTLICLNTGLNDMGGWHRIQVKIARYLAGKGFNILRFDDTGIGDSEGEILENSIVKIFSDIESGLFVPNADSAVSYIKKELPNDKIIYLGFCGGGLTAVHSAVNNKNVVGVINIGGPITLSSKDYLQKTDPWEVKKNVNKYKSKFFQLGPWIRFFTGQGEYSNITRSLIHYIKHKISGEYKDRSIQSKEHSKDKNLNVKFFNSYEEYIKSKRPILFYFAEIDAATWEFKKYFFNKYKNTKFWPENLVDFFEIIKANHIFSDLDSQEQMKHDILKWLQQFT